MTMKITQKAAVSGLLFSLCLVPSAFADKPEWAGSKGKPDQQQVEAHKAEMKAKRGDVEQEMAETEDRAEKEKMKKEKQLKQEKDKKQKQMREHQDDAGMESEEMKQERERMHQSDAPSQPEGKSKKWWKFWGSEEE